jgi:hypothetical protein
MTRAASLTLLLAATVQAQDFLSGEFLSDRTLALIEREGATVSQRIKTELSYRATQIVPG